MLCNVNTKHDLHLPWLCWHTGAWLFRVWILYHALTHEIGLGRAHYPVTYSTFVYTSTYKVLYISVFTFHFNFQHTNLFVHTKAWLTSSDLWQILYLGIFWSQEVCLHYANPCGSPCSPALKKNKIQVRHIRSQHITGKIMQD